MSTLQPFTAVDTRALDLDPSPVPDDQRLAGTPATGAVRLGTVGGANIGVWEMTAGGMRDVEVDEVFLVIDGEATVTWTRPDGTETTIELRPGVLCRLEAGMTTRWDVTRNLRKFYLAGPYAEAARG